MAWTDENQLLVKEHVGMFKAANEYDVFALDGTRVLEIREPGLGGLTRLLRFTDYKRFTPYDMVVTDVATGETVVRVKRGVTFLRSRVEVLDGDGRVLGGFRQKLLSLGGRFTVLDARERPVFDLKGKWTSWEFRFTTPGGRELARVTKKWAGLGKELFTSADNYVLDISPDVGPDSDERKLVLAAVASIDLVLKE